MNPLVIVLPVVVAEMHCAIFLPKLYLPLAILPACRPTLITWSSISKRVRLEDNQGNRYTRSEDVENETSHRVRVTDISVRLRYRSVWAKGDTSTGDAWLIIRNLMRRKMNIVRVRFYATPRGLELRSSLSLPVFGFDEIGGALRHAAPSSMAA